MMRLIVTGVLLLHSLFKASGTVFAYGGLENQWSGVTPWALGADLTLRSPGGRMLSLLWLAACAILLAGTYGFWAQKEWFRILLIAGSGLAIVATAPWVRAIPADQFFMMVSLDVVVLMAMLLKLDLKWL